MDADLLGLSKPSSGAGKTAGKGPGKCDPLGGGVKSTGKPLPAEKGKKEILLFFPQPGRIFIWDREQEVDFPPKTLLLILFWGVLF